MPKPLPASKKLARLKKHSYETLLRVVRSGRPVMDPRTGEQRTDEDGKPVFTPATAADLSQSRLLQKELEAEARSETQNPYTSHQRDRANLREALIDLGYTAAEVSSIIEKNNHWPQD